MPVKEVIINRLKEVMADQRLKSQRAFALAISADPSFFDKIIKGKKDLTEGVASNLEAKFGVSQEWLYHGRGPKYGPKPNDSPKEDYQIKYIKQLEKENEYLQGIVKTNLTLVLATVQTLSVRQRAVGETILDSLERIESASQSKKKSSGALVADAGRRIDQIEREAFGHGSEA